MPGYNSGTGRAFPVPTMTKPIAPPLTPVPPPVPETPRPLASQTLFRGLDIVDTVARGVTTLPEISAATGISFSTAHRLASALVQSRYLAFEPRKGYSLGVKLIELGFLAYRQADLPRRARATIEQLAAATSDTVHLAIREGDEVVYLDKLPGQRAVEISSRIGGRKPIFSTGVGKALLLDADETEWKRVYAQADVHTDEQIPRMTEAAWLSLMAGYARAGYAFDLGEDHATIRCVAVPIRDAAQRIVAAVSVSSTVQYMDDARMQALIPLVRRAAAAISSQIGGPG